MATDFWHRWSEVTLVIGSVFTIVAATLGVTIRLAKQHIRTASKEVVREELDRQMGPLRLQLTTMTGELARVRDLEAKIENGLTHRTHEIAERQQRIENKIDGFIEHLIWDGTTERRSDDG